MHVAHAAVGPIERRFWDGWGAESGVQIGEGVGAVGRERGGEGLEHPPVVEERDGGRAACVHAWTGVSSVNLGGTFSIPMGGVAGVPNKGVISVVLRSCSSWSIYGPTPWDYCCSLFEVAVRVWCRVAAGSEVVAEVFLEASELGVCSLVGRFW